MPNAKVPTGEKHHAPAYANDPAWLEVLANLTGPLPTSMRKAAKTLGITRQALLKRMGRSGFTFDPGTRCWHPKKTSK